MIHHGLTEDEFSKFRNLDEWLKRFVNWILLAIPIVGCSFTMDGPFYLNWTILMEQYYGIMIAMIFPCVFFLMLMTNRAPKNRVPWCDVVLAILSIIVGLYVAIFYHQISLSLGNVASDRVIVGTIAIALTLEASRLKFNA